MEQNIVIQRSLYQFVCVGGGVHTWAVNNVVQITYNDHWYVLIRGFLKSMFSF